MLSVNTIRYTVLRQSTEDLKQTLLCHLPSFENVFSNSAASTSLFHPAMQLGARATLHAYYIVAKDFVKLILIFSKLKYGPIEYCTLSLRR